ncbi:response regulator receiver protein [Chthoniobacter flavus Ellin428]|uniref:Response regulator receiver protein n=1 Tax=Chthoniobacter flavus Ellin428 TaxID=497964 RepID=B4D8W3_9BACT|nr:response regulator [Chthoniobacter flavus]EDY17171.1 response regulator receiver protein [Chthoniobacter flavus Ellin428]
MSQPHKLSDYSEFQPKKERRTPLPITNLPVNAISEDSDPTLEIRNLIEQLQQTARDSRGQVHTAERERDGIALELKRAQQQIEALRENERELRSHFVEITSLIQERDTAQQEAERRGKALAEAAKKSDQIVRERNDAQRQRDEVLRQRDEATRKLDAIQRGTDEQARLVSESQKQLLNIRQARDGAHAQILELNTRLGEAEDKIADLEYQRDNAHKAGKETESQATELRRQIDVIATDRDATAQQVQALTAELDSQRQKYLDLAEQKSAAQQADSEHTAALAEARAQVAGLTQDRDVARSRAQDQAKELDELRVQFQTFRDEQAQTANAALAEMHEKLAALETQAREGRHEANNLRQKIEAKNEKLTALQTLVEQAGNKRTETEQELEAITKERNAALTSLTAAQKQIDHIIRDRDEVRKLATENALELEERLVKLQEEVASFETVLQEHEQQKYELNEIRERFETQRLETIELATQLQTAQREIRELSANIAEARLQVKFAQAEARAAKEGKTKSDFASLMPTETPAPAPTPVAAAPVEAAPVIAAEAAPIAPESVAVEEAPAAPVENEIFTEPGSIVPLHSAPAPVAQPGAPSQPAAAARIAAPVLGIAEPLTEKESRSVIGAMRHCFQSFTKTPNDLSLLNELHCHVESFAERARVSGLLALHRLCSSFANLTRGLYEIPEQVNPSTLRTVHQTIEFLAALMKERNLAQVKDPATAMIYAVDDDLGNCESIALAMEESGMRTIYAQDPALALGELASSRYDLIFLDVNLPGMDGFELCKQTRALAIHEKTPIVFLTGLATLENRVQSSLSGGNDFIAKPFNLHELSVKAITLLLKAQLHLA